MIYLHLTKNVFNEPSSCGHPSRRLSCSLRLQRPVSGHSRGSGSLPSSVEDPDPKLDPYSAFWWIQIQILNLNQDPDRKKEKKAGLTKIHCIRNFFMCHFLMLYTGIQHNKDVFQILKKSSSIFLSKVLVIRNNG